MLWVGTGMMPSNNKAATRNDLNYVGSFTGLMTATPSDASADEMVPGDIATAKAFGQRVAEAPAAGLKPGRANGRATVAPMNTLGAALAVQPRARALDAAGHASRQPHRRRPVTQSLSASPRSSRRPPS
jgi:hypothetical protein